MKNYPLLIASMINSVKPWNVLRKLSALSPRQSLLTIYKSFIRPHLDYGDVIYDQPRNESRSKRKESVHHKAALAITGVMQRSSRKKLYQELCLEHLHQRRWMRRLCLFYKVFYSIVPKYSWDLSQDYQIHVLLFVVGPSIFKILFYLTS